MVKPTPPTAPEAPLRSDPAFSTKAQTFLTWLAGGFNTYVGDAVDYVDERADEALAAATTFGFPSIAGKGLNFTRVNAGATALEFRTPAQVRSDIGATAVGSSLFTAANALAAASTIGFSNSLAAAGWQQLPGGLILQWHTFTTSTAGGVTWTFPIAFPSGCFGGSVTSINNAFGHVGTFDSTPSVTQAIVSTWNLGSRTAVSARVFVLGW